MKTIHHFKDLYLVAIEAMEAVYAMQEEAARYQLKHGNNDKVKEAIERIGTITKLLEAYTSLIAIYESLRLDNQIKDSRYLELVNEVNELRKKLDLRIQNF
jgi:regulator of sigma D